MVCRFFSVTIFIMSLLSVAAPAHAERRMALVIGNGDYAVGPLDNPANDARLMAKSLVDVGFEVTHLENLGYRALQRSVVKFSRDLRAAGEDTVGMVFYAGHAVQANGENYLIPIDSDIEDALDLEIQTLEVSTLMRSLEAAGNRLNMVVLDACRNNPFKSMSRSSSRGLAKVDAPYGTLLAYSTAPGSVAADGIGQNSPYTSALAKALRQPGVPVEQIFKQVRINVMERTGNRQVPWESSSLTGDFFFSEAAPVVEAPAPVVAPTPTVPNQNAEIEFWKSIAAGSNPVLFRSYLEAYPNGLFRSLAEQRISMLESAAARQAEQEKENAQRAEAQAVWDQVKDSGNPALLQSIVDRYGDTLYAELARVQIASLNQTQRSAAPTPAQNDTEAENLFWQSIQNSTSKGDYEAYLAQYPNGSFASIASNRAENGYAPQVAALPPTSSDPYDGEWILHLESRSGASSYWVLKGLIWCAWGEEGESIVQIKNGTFETSVLSDRYNRAQVEGVFSDANQVSLKMTGIPKDTSIGRGLGEVTLTRVKDTRYEGTGILKADSDECKFEVSLRRSE
jgi:caspase domain-containing protein